MNAFLLCSSMWMAGDCHGCSTPAPSCNTCDKVSLLDKIRARFAKSNDCGCDAPKCCEKAPKCHTCEKAPKCKPACGTPLFSKASCDSCDPCASKPSLLDKLRAKFAKKDHCCETPVCGGCGAAAPSGCALPPAPGAAPAAPSTDAPKVMPAPVAPKKTTSIEVPSIVTPASVTVPAIPVPAPISPRPY